jgi:hypothetical protein
MALAIGDSASALRELLNDHRRSPTDVLTEPIDRCRIAELLNRAGRTSDAEAWYGSAGERQK